MSLLETRLTEYASAPGCTVFEPSPGSPVHDADAYLGQYPISLYVHSQITIVRDILNALHDVMLTTDENGAPKLLIPGHGPYSLIRSAMETAVQAVWVLTPTTTQDRIKRRLLIRARSVIEKEKALTARILGPKRGGNQTPTLSNSGYTPSQLSKLLNTAVNHAEEDLAALQELATSANTSIPKERRDILSHLSFSAMLMDAERHFPNLEQERIEAAWRFCSAFSHGIEWAQTVGQDRVKLGPTNQSGIALFAYHIDLTLFSQYGSLTLALVDEVIELFHTMMTPTQKTRD